MATINLREYDFNHVVDCIYKENKYSVRDNGAVMRHPRIGKHPRPLDNQWTFGKPCSHKGYLLIAGVQVHRIVATAFHGEASTKEHVVDHIDTNRLNNRPENIRWLTRLENVLKNPITVRRIELACGSIEAFLENPSILKNSNFDQNFKWMRNVSPEEAQACKQRLEQWAKSGLQPSGGSLGEWLFKPIKAKETKPSPTKNVKEFKPNTTKEYSHFPKFFNEVGITDLVPSKTPTAAQRNWNTPTEFPCCPQSATEEPLKAYADKLTPGVLFSCNQYSTSLVLDFAMIESNQSILVLCQKAETGEIKPWTLAKVTYENGLYVHKGLGTFFEKEGAKKQFCLAKGLEWTGGDNIDDFC
jgi:hypothetical protein